MAGAIHILINSLGRFPFSTLSSVFIVCGFFDHSHLTSVKWSLPHYNFDLHFSIIINDVGHLSCPSWSSVCLPWRNIRLGLLPIFWSGCLFFLILSCLYILEINPLSVASFANIFSYSEGCLFILFTVSFAVHKLLNLIRSHLFIFVFIFITLGGGSKKILLWFMSKSVLIMFSSISFITSSLTFRSLFWVYFCVWCYGVF